MILKTLLTSNNLLEELNAKEANDILVRASPRDVSNQFRINTTELVEIYVNIDTFIYLFNTYLSIVFHCLFIFQIFQNVQVQSFANMNRRQSHSVGALNTSANGGGIQM